MINSLYFNYKIPTKLLIFKTNINTKKKVKALKSFFDSHTSITKWSIDLEDIDNVLKIEAAIGLNESNMIDQIKTQGFYCDVLSD
ncbi:hypothetical protein VOI54_10390 [Tamlana sp. 2201CG12-4]|uniref:hypothetical protein n=1 Tax=Tamlana sp. 2201CG12-4 TaxID=3112582 RepID=UPI002DBA08D5|nr:hypothetical protein [Tamlana sp. 2201CG12-4]MEC3907428.1 hypothetical protein [Tamlana sp. 2201CG12-4]